MDEKDSLLIRLTQSKEQQQQLDTRQQHILAPSQSLGTPFIGPLLLSERFQESQQNVFFPINCYGRHVLLF